jgi:hypothetical protein
MDLRLLTTSAKPIYAYIDYFVASMPFGSIKDNLTTRSKAEAIMLQLVAYRHLSKKNMACDLLAMKTAAYVLMRKSIR